MPLLKNYLKKVEEENYNSAAIAYLAALDHLGERNPLIVEKIIDELKAQRNSLKLIASENYSSLATQLAMANLLTDKYCEGYPSHRFYAGCENVDIIEEAAVESLKDLFGAEHAYVQPHSGADANLVAFWSVLIHKIQDPRIKELGKKNAMELSEQEHEEIRSKLVSQKVLGMAISSGGHLTHGYRLNISSKMMQAATYEVDPKTGLLDYDALEKQAKDFKPLILLAGYSAYPRKINFKRMKEIADSVGAVLIVDMAHFSGLVAGKVFTGEFDPVPYADIVTSTTHKTLRGPRGGMILCKKEYKEVIDKGCPIVLGGPLPHVIAAKAVAFEEASTADFKAYAHQVVNNARSLANYLVSKGVKLVTEGTDNHLLIINCMESFGLNGRQAERALRDHGLTVNRNMLPFDAKGPWYTSGIRLGTPALTTRGMKENEMELIAQMIITVLTAAVPSRGEKPEANYEIDPRFYKDVEAVKKAREELLNQFPLYPELIID